MVESKEDKREVVELVVKELPQQEVRVYIGDEGKKEYHLITHDEALMEILKLLRGLDKRL